MEVRSVFLVGSFLVGEAVFGAMDCQKLISALAGRPRYGEKAVWQYSELLSYARAQRGVDDRILEKLKEKLILGTFPRLFHKQEGEDFVLFLANLKEKEQLLAIGQLGELLEDNPRSPLMKRFAWIRRWNDYWDNHYFKENLSRLSEEDMDGKRGHQSFALKRRARRQTDDFMVQYRRLKFECTASSWNDTRRNARRQFTRFMMGAGYASFTISMWSHNRDRRFSDAGMQYAYEVSFALAKSFFMAQILSNPQSSHVMKGVLKYGLSRGIGVVDAALFDQFLHSPWSYFGQETRRRFEEMTVHPQRAVMLEELGGQSEGIIEEFWDNLLILLGKNLNLLGLKGSLVEGHTTGWDEISEESFQREETRELIMTAISKILYEERKGRLIVTGNHALDRYTFDTLFGFVELPHFVWSGLYIHHKICMGALDGRNYISALAFFVLDRVLVDQVYSFTRRKFIGL